MQQSPTGDRARKHRTFFVGMVAFLALIVLVGFSKEFYLRPFNVDARQLTPLIYLHGVVFTLWVVLLVLQTALVASRRVIVHRQMGIAGIVLAPAMVVAGALAQIEHTQRVIDSGEYRENHWHENFLFVIPLWSTLVFGALVATAILLRRDAESHKRIMICATVTIVFAAVGRLPGAGSLGELGVLALTDVLLLPLVFFDVVSRKSVHPATLWGGGAVLSLLAIASSPVILSERVNQLIQFVAG
jgi:hypothetical protein